MITKKGVFYLICFIGYVVIVLNFIPVEYDRRIFHIGFFPEGNSSDIYHEYISYRRLAIYLIMWPVFCYLLFQLSNEIKIKHN